MFSENKFEDTKGIIRSRKWKKDRQHNDQKKRDKGTNKDLQQCVLGYCNVLFLNSLNTVSFQLFILNDI
jgi:hypothetical protein